MLALIRTWFLGDKNGRCGDQCGSLCKGPCESFEVSHDNATCTCLGSMCGENAICTVANVCECLEEYTGDPFGAGCTKSSTLLAAINATADQIDLFLMDDGSSIPELQPFMALVRSQIPSSLNLHPTDRDILQVIIQPQFEKNESRRHLWSLHNGKQGMKASWNINERNLGRTFTLPRSGSIHPFIERFQNNGLVVVVDDSVDFLAGQTRALESENCIEAVIMGMVALWNLIVSAFIPSLTSVVGSIGRVLAKKILARKPRALDTLIPIFLKLKAFTAENIVAELGKLFEKFITMLVETVGVKGILDEMLGVISYKDTWIIFGLFAAEMAAAAISFGSSLLYKIARMVISMLSVVKSIQSIDKECFSFSNPCLVDGIPIDCNDSNECTSDSCNPTTGSCIHAQIDCNDRNACTADSCDPDRGCLNSLIPMDCDDSDRCTVDFCDPNNGLCSHTPLVCNDFDACTNDSCNSATGTCVFTRIENCVDGHIICSSGDYSGKCMDKALCIENGGVTIIGRCPVEGDFQCCLDSPSPPECTALDKYPGDCTTINECNGRPDHTPITPTPEFGCSGGKTCCVDSPACTSGLFSGTCLHTSTCAFDSIAGECPGDGNIQCCIDFGPCTVGEVHGKCKNKDRCTGQNQYPLKGFCGGDSEVQCCIDMPSCLVAGVNGQCMPTDKCNGLPALSWHNCLGKVSNDISCCIPALECFGFDDESVWVHGQCERTCGGTTTPIIPQINSTLEYCPDGLSCCAPKRCVVADVKGECLPTVDCMKLPALSWHNCSGSDISCCLPSLECFGFDDKAVWVQGQCERTCGGTTNPIIPQINSTLEYCPDGLVCCIPMNMNEDWQTIDIFGPFIHQAYGYATAISANGLVFASGYGVINGLESGFAKAYSYDKSNDVWKPMGSTYFGGPEDTSLGTAVALSADGRVMAVGAPWSVDNPGYGAIKVLRYNDNGDIWEDVGDVIYGSEELHCYFGSAVAISSDGKTVAGGQWVPCIVHTNGAQSGEGDARVVRYNNVSGKWDQLGQTLTDKSGNGLFVSILSFIGGSGDKLATIGPNASVQILQYNSTLNEWVQQGAAWDASGNFGFALSSDGSLIVGTIVSEDGETAEPQKILESVQVFQNLGESGWNLRETFRVDSWDVSEIENHTFSGKFPFPVALSSNGSILVTSGLNRVHIFEYRGNKTWVEISNSTSFSGEEGDMLGSSVDMSSDGSVIVVGAPGFDGPGGNDTGLVRVYRRLLH
jgi:Dictyostelium (slime mold) repeat